MIVYDADGYTPAERAAWVKKQAPPEIFKQRKTSVATSGLIWRARDPRAPRKASA